MKIAALIIFIGLSIVTSIRLQAHIKAPDTPQSTEDAGITYAHTEANNQLNDSIAYNQKSIDADEAKIAKINATMAADNAAGEYSEAAD